MISPKDCSENQMCSKEAMEILIYFFQPTNIRFCAANNLQ